MPEASASVSHQAVQQTVREVLHGVHDPQRAAAMIAAVVAHHAPELQAWAQARLRARHPSARFPAHQTIPIAKPPEAQFQAIFGVQPVVAPQPLPAASDARPGAQDAHLRVDPELGRLCVALHRAPELRLWVVIRQQVRDEGGSGWIERNCLVEVLKTHQVDCSARHLRRLLALGEGVFWNVTRERVYMRSWGYVATCLTQAALAAKVGVIERNRPGVRQVYVPVGGSLEQWEAQLYAAWLSYRNNPTISRSQLSKLFGRDQTILRRWEQRRLVGQLTVRHNFAQCPDHERFFEHIPHYATNYVAWVRWQGKPRRVARIRWQLPNTYLVGTIKEHHKKGQAAKVRRRVNAETEIMPADERRGGWPRLYFDQAGTLRKFVCKHPEAEARYVWRGENRVGQGILEINGDGFPLTHALERAKPRDERMFLLVQGGG